MELCGGSHVKNVGQIGLFRIVSETGVASGVRRIEAITGKAALEQVRHERQLLEQTAALLKTRPEDVAVQAEKMLEAQKEMQKQVDEFRAVREKADAQKLLMGVEEINGINYVSGGAEAESMDALRNLADVVMEKVQNCVVVLAAVNQDKVNLVVKADKNAVARGIHAGKIIKEAAKLVGGGGGGRPDMAQAGGKKPENIEAAFAKAEEMVRSQLG